jgi:hypothetical protein
MMLKSLLSKFSTPRDLSDDDILDVYGELLENLGMVEPVSKLPAPKARIKAALLNRAKLANDQEMQALMVAYLCLAQFQDTTLGTINPPTSAEIKQMNGDQLADVVLKMGPQIQNTKIIEPMVTLERRVLAEEWDQANA